MNSPSLLSYSLPQRDPRSGRTFATREFVIPLSFVHLSFVIAKGPTAPPFLANHLRNPAPMHYAPSSFKEMEVLEKSASWQRAARSFKADDLNVQVFDSLDDLAQDAAAEVNKFLSGTLREKGSAAAILATGNSQIQFLKRLVALEGIDWSKITLFHMDEYMGIDANHKASFRKYMRERVQTLVQPKAFHFLEGDADLPLDECARYESLLKAQAIDLCCLGIGENGHLAFNDPPVARFDDKRLVKLVKLDDACKMQQVKEGHFPSLEAVPPYAFTLTIPALCSARKMVCIAPEKRKADAVRAALKGPIATSCPASFLRKQKHCTLLLDGDSAAGL